MLAAGFHDQPELGTTGWQVLDPNTSSFLCIVIFGRQTGKYRIDRNQAQKLHYCSAWRSQKLLRINFPAQNRINDTPTFCFDWQSESRPIFFRLWSSSSRRPTWKEDRGILTDVSCFFHICIFNHRDRLLTDDTALVMIKDSESIKWPASHIPFPLNPSAQIYCPLPLALSHLPSCF